ncbi:hypothetical protein C0583_04900 [Candidatus Parcubacteria bacterium]|nr:MAG: hypothetical protein C0583_04900 [Candidatus Parcubacteria bacterium]
MQEQPTTSDINQESELDKEQQTESNLEKIEESAITKIDYIKVPVKRLDSLLDLVEELLINRMHIEEISQRNPELKNVFSHMDMLISGIQFEVTQSRLVPVEQAFARFPRMIRDLSQKENKKINFEVSGGEIELDRSVVDKLGEPLIHLLRNAVDHGITEEGKINLSAIRKSERVQFVVENIGEKINIEKIKKVALSKGLVTTQTISEMKESAIIDFIFHPNFSTKDHVTEISGRGVGLNVVKKFADSFNGRILAENTDKGARFILELPQTLAIIETLLVEVNKSIFAIPFTDIERSVKVYNTDIKRMADRDMGVIDGTNIPLIDLSESFKYVDAIKKVVHVKNSEGKKISNSELTNPEELKTTENQEKAIKKDHKLVVLVKKEEGMAGIVVDSLITEQEVIVKPFTSMLQNIKEFSGSTILGDGRVVLILDVLNIIKTLNKL